MKKTILLILFLTILILAGCSTRYTGHVDTDVYAEFNDFLSHSLGNYLISRENARRQTIDAAFGFGLERRVTTGYQWTATFTDSEGNDNSFTFTNLHGFSHYVLLHAQNQINNQLQALLSQHFTAREIGDYRLQIGIEPRHRREDTPSISDPQYGLVLYNLSLYEINTFFQHDVIISSGRYFNILPLENHEYRQRFENLLMDTIALLDWHDVEMILGREHSHPEFVARLTYNHENGSMTWRYRTRPISFDYTDCGRPLRLWHVYFNNEPIHATNPNHRIVLLNWSDEYEDYLFYNIRRFLLRSLVNRELITIDEYWDVRSRSWWEDESEPIYTWSIGGIAYESRAPFNYLIVNNNGEISRIPIRGENTISWFAEVTGANIRFDLDTWSVHFEWD